MKKVNQMILSILLGTATATQAEVVKFDFRGTVDSYIQKDNAVTDDFQFPDDMTNVGFTISISFDTSDLIGGEIYGPWSWGFNERKLGSISIEFDNGLYWATTELGSPGFIVGPSTLTAFTSVGSDHIFKTTTDTNMPVGNNGESLQLDFDITSDLIDTGYYYNFALEGLEYLDELRTELRGIRADELTSTSMSFRVSNELVEDFIPCGSPEGYCTKHHSGSYTIRASNLTAAAPLPDAIGCSYPGSVFSLR